MSDRDSPDDGGAPRATSISVVGCRCCGDVTIFLRDDDGNTLARAIFKPEAVDDVVAGLLAERDRPTGGVAPVRH